MDRRDFLKTGSVASMALLPKVPIIQEYEVRKYKYFTEWYFNNEIHREDGPAVEYLSGSRMWYLNGLLHREDGPAIDFVNSKYWYLNGLALENYNVDREWWFDNKKPSDYVSESELFTTKIVRKIKFV